MIQALKLFCVCVSASVGVLLLFSNENVLGSYMLVGAFTFSVMYIEGHEKKGTKP